MFAPDGVILDDSREIAKEVGTDLDVKIASHDGCIGELPDNCALAGATHTTKSYYTADDKPYVCLAGFHLMTI